MKFPFYLPSSFIVECQSEVKLLAICSLLGWILHYPADFRVKLGYKLFQSNYVDDNHDDMKWLTDSAGGLVAWFGCKVCSLLCWLAGVARKCIAFFRHSFAVTKVYLRSAIYIQIVAMNFSLFFSFIFPRGFIMAFSMRRNFSYFSLKFN